jgi:hypothetical protein
MSSSRAAWPLTVPPVAKGQRLLRAMFLIACSICIAASRWRSSRSYASTMTVKQGQKQNLPTAGSRQCERASGGMSDRGRTPAANPSYPRRRSAAFSASSETRGPPEGGALSGHRGSGRRSRSFHSSGARGLRVARNFLVEGLEHEEGLLLLAVVGDEALAVVAVLNLRQRSAWRLKVCQNPG